MPPRKKSTLPEKAKVREALLAALREGLAAMARSAMDSAAGATHEENRSEGDKDMRATEESYVARGKAMRAEELAEELAKAELLVMRSFGEDDPIAPSAIVRVLVEGEPKLFFVSTQGGGRTLKVDGHELTVVTPASPVGRALVGKKVGDDFELAVKGALREWEIDAVA
jgi:transcription elongation GreA/GreB family factor